MANGGAGVEDTRALGLLAFWIDAGPERWFTRSDGFDTACCDFIALWEEGREGALDGWASTAAGS